MSTWTINVWLLWALVVYATINTSLALKDRISRARRRDEK